MGTVNGTTPDNIKKKILIIGTIPPPIGGVTIHLKRLINRLEIEGVSFEFLDIKRLNKVDFLRGILKHEIIHSNTSSPTLRFLLTLFGKIFRKHIIVTFHGDLNRYGKIKNWMDRQAVRLSYIPIVLNEGSYRLACQLNRKVKLISAFIPPIGITPLPEEFIFALNRLRTEYKTLYCTNASTVAFDNEGNEIYLISSLVNLFNKHREYGLIISDSSGRYKDYLLKKKINLPENILLISIPHDFNAVIADSNCLLRFTTTDGDSLSVKEALYQNKMVIATDVVARPEGVIIVKPNLTDLERIITIIDAKDWDENKPFGVQVIADGMVDLLAIYDNLLTPPKAEA